MMEKRNTTVEKAAAGDAGVFDDLVDMTAGKLDRLRRAPGLDPRRRERQLASEAAGEPAPDTAVC
jgi:hypothetical protein